MHRGLESLDADVLEVLRLGAYQLLYMGGVPAYAAVSQAVDQARAHAGSGAAGLVNAVLRKVGEAGDALDRFPAFESDPVGFLSTWGSHPRWLVERWLGRWSATDVRRLVEADNERPPLYLTPLGVGPEVAVERLAEAGLAAEPVGERTGSVRMGAGVRPDDALAALPDAVVQDPAASLVARYADIPPGTKVADLCAAPGGKVLAVSGRPVYTLAADRSESRLRMVRENARRTGRPVGLVVADALRPPVAAVDVVMLDVPCTGTGTFARRPDARWRLEPSSVDEMARLQREMLATAAEAVEDGGLLVYSTCSLEPEENEDCVAGFLEGNRGFRVEATDAVPEGFRNDAGCLVVTPQETGFDGAFAARMRRTG